MVRFILIMIASLTLVGCKSNICNSNQNSIEKCKQFESTDSYVPWWVDRDRL